MGAIKDKIVGKAKQVEGRLTGDKIRETQGTARKAKGDVEGKLEKGKFRARAKIDEMKIRGRAKIDEMKARRAVKKATR
jgi:uncharacterized protein YjbJ (UPF0337 family)